MTRLPLLNKDTAFSAEERRIFGLDGILPGHVSSLDEQVHRSYVNFKSFKTMLDQHVYLRVLQDRNEVLFYALLERHLEELMPVIYTPTVAEAVRQFSLIHRYPRGLVVNTENIDHVGSILESSQFPATRLIVATDAEGILGIGDQGIGGLAICIGKLSIYSAAGIDPSGDAYSPSFYSGSSGSLSGMSGMMSELSGGLTGSLSSSASAPSSGGGWGGGGGGGGGGSGGGGGGGGGGGW